MLPQVGGAGDALAGAKPDVLSWFIHMIAAELDLKLCCCRWEERVTHVVAPSLKRVAKVLAAMAAGAWVVSTEYLTASRAAHALVDPVLPNQLHAVIKLDVSINTRLRQM